MDKTAKILIGEVAAGLGLAYYFLRKPDTKGPMSEGDLEKIIGDKSEVDFLHEILEYLRAEYTTFYIHYSNLIREATNSYGHNHELVKATIIEVMDRLEEKLHHTDEKVWAKFNINQATLENLIEKHQTPHWKYVKKLTMQNKQRVMNGEEIDFELYIKLTQIYFLWITFPKTNNKGSL